MSSYPQVTPDEALEWQESYQSLRGWYCCCGRKLTPRNHLRRFIGYDREGLPTFELWCIPCVEAGVMEEPGGCTG